MLLPLVLFHELGHYVAARLFGVYVESFSVGFGPKLFGWTDKRGTVWKFCPLLLGGYVQILARPKKADESVKGASLRQKLSVTDPCNSLSAKAPWQKMIIALAGPLANYILAIVLLFSLFSTVGQTVFDPVVGKVSVNSPAERSGLQQNDRIITLQGQTIKTFHDVLNVLEATPADKNLIVIVDRSGETIMLSAAPDKEGLSGCWIGRLGVAPHPSFTKQKHMALSEAFYETISLVEMLSIAPLKMLGQGKVDGMMGPLGIAHQAGSVLSEGMISILFYMATLSVGLGLINLFPIPALDGGMVLFAFVEGFLGKPLSDRVQHILSTIAMVALLVLFVFFSYKDLLRIPAVAALLR